MSELEEKAAEVINKAKNKCFNGCQGMPEHYCEGVCGIEDAKEILSLIQIEVDCKECYHGTMVCSKCPLCEDNKPCCKICPKCPTCKGTGKVRVPMADGVQGIAREVDDGNKS